MVNSMASPQRQGNLWSASVYTILEGESSLLQRRLQRKICIFPYTGIKDWSSNDINLIKPRTRLLIRCCPPLIVYSLIITVVVVSALKVNEVPGISGLLIISSALLAIYCCVHSIQVCMRADEFLIPDAFYEMILAGEVRHKKSLISKFQKSLPLGGCADPKALARLIAAASFSPGAAALLFEHGSVWEFRQMLEEVRRMNIPPYQLGILHEDLRSLIEAPPSDETEYRGLVLRVSRLLETKDDYFELRSLLPQGDPRLRFLEYASDADSAESSESRDSVYIDIPSDEIESFSVVIGDQSFDADASQLQKKSHWFKVFFEGKWGEIGSKIVLSDEVEYREDLMLILSNLNRIPSLWHPVDPDKKWEYLRLFKCLHYYGFVEDLNLLAMTLTDELLLDRSEIFYVATRVVTASHVSPEILNTWWERIYALIKYEPVDGKILEDALDFALKYFHERITLLYAEYLENKNTYFDPEIIKAIVRRRNQLVRAEARIQVIVLSLIDSFYFDIAPYKDDAEFLDWFALLIRRSPQVITLKNFKTLWPLHEHNQEIGNLLVSFASSHKLEVIRLWWVGEVPDELIERLPS